MAVAIAAIGFVNNGFAQGIEERGMGDKGAKVLSGSEALRLKESLMRPERSREWMQDLTSHAGRNRASGGGSEAYPDLDTLGALDQLVVGSGPLRGAVLTAPFGYVNWYFGALALLHFVDDRPDVARNFVDAYLRNVNDDATIYDAVPDYYNSNSGVPTLLAPDSHDSYAAMVVALASKVYLLTNDTAWFTGVLPKLKWLVQRNLLDSQNPATGLVRVFQDPATPTWSPGVEYLMDNCEVYYGLNAFEEALLRLGDGAATVLEGAKNRLSQGMVLHAFRSNPGAWAHASQAQTVGVGFYPYSTAQVFPIVFDVPVGQDKLDAGWNYLTTTTDMWWKAGRYDDFPWLILAYAAAKRGETDLATAHLNSAFKHVRSKPQFFTVNELAFWHATAKLI